MNNLMYYKNVNYIYISIPAGWVNLFRISVFINDVKGFKYQGEITVSDEEMNMPEEAKKIYRIELLKRLKEEKEFFNDIKNFNL